MHEAQFSYEVARLVYEGHAAHAANEMRIMYGEVLKEGERLGVAMPHFRGLQMGQGANQ